MLTCYISPPAFGGAYQNAHHFAIMDLPIRDKKTTYLVVGAGVFGLSAAYELKRTKRQATVILLDEADCPSQAGASFDHNKIIRSDYRDVFYMKLALKAIEQWKTNPLFVESYHETGMIFADNTGRGKDFSANYEGIKHEAQANLMSVKEACAHYPWFREAKWDGVEQAYFNANSGWGDAELALHTVADAAKALGVLFIQEKVTRLEFEHRSGRSALCLGLHTAQGGFYAGDHIVLCAGAGMAKLLADSAPKYPCLQIGDRLAAAAALSCKIKVPDHLKDKYEGAPVFAHLMAHTKGEAVPVTRAGYIKINSERTFTNIQAHVNSGSTFSTPPGRPLMRVWTRDAPEELRIEALNVLHNIYGPAPELEPEEYRLCWDAITPTQDWIISRHGACEALYVATGGSFHAWKFFPILGKQIVAMLDNTLDEEKSSRWKWAPSSNLSRMACDSYIPKRDLAAIFSDAVRRA